MLTITLKHPHPKPIDKESPIEPATVLVIGRSEKVLTQTVQILVAKGHTAGATNNLDRASELFDATPLTTVVFGGQVPLDIKEKLCAQFYATNPALDFIQGLAGIPGLIAAQVDATRTPRNHTSTVDYDAGERTIKLCLDQPRRVRIVGFWHTAFVPPDPASTSQTIIDTTMPAGGNTLPLPAAVPVVASFVVVYLDQDIIPITIGAVSLAAGAR